MSLDQYKTKAQSISSFHTSSLVSNTAVRTLEPKVCPFYGKSEIACVIVFFVYSKFFSVKNFVCLCQVDDVLGRAEI